MRSQFRAQQTLQKTRGPESARRRWFRFGPGTILAVVIAAIVVASGQLNRPEPMDAGRIAYEADSQGRLRKVDRPTAYPSSAIPSLWKPSPAFFLKHSSTLRLSHKQTAQVKKLDSAWSRERSALEAAIQQVTPSFQNPASESNAPRGLSTNVITTGLGEYSVLSRQYNDRRESYWSHAVALLDRAQIKRLEDLKKGAMRSRGPQQ